MKILNFGSCNIDFVYDVKRIAREGETISASCLHQFAGGKGLNQSIAIARSGALVYHAGCIGEDGIFLKELMDSSGVVTNFMQVLNTNSGYAIIQVADNGANSIVLFDGANSMISTEYVDYVLSFFSKGEYLLLQNEINNLEYIINKAFSIGMKIVLNPSPFNEKIKNISIDKLSWIIINEVESEQITGCDDPLDSICQLKERYPRLNIIITLGKNGCVFTDGDKIKKQNAFYVEPVDTTGAGDTFTGYFFGTIALGKNPTSAAREASLAAALSTLKKGAAVSIPMRSEVEEASKNLIERGKDYHQVKLIKEIETYIDKHLATVCLDDLANVLNYTISYTSRWIKVNMHLSFKDLVQKRRCEVAAELLKNTDLLVSDIISKVGYNNETFFRNKFIELYGKNPKKYRDFYKANDDLKVKWRR